MHDNLTGKKGIVGPAGDVYNYYIAELIGAALFNIEIYKKEKSPDCLQFAIDVLNKAKRDLEKHMPKDFQDP